MDNKKFVHLTKKGFWNGALSKRRSIEFIYHQRWSIPQRPQLCMQVCTWSCCVCRNLIASSKLFISLYRLRNSKFLTPVVVILINHYVFRHYFGVEFTPQLLKINSNSFVTSALSPTYRYLPWPTTILATTYMESKLKNLMIVNPSLFD